MFYTRYKRPANPAIDFSESPSLARQEYEPECNINNILAKFKVTGVLIDPSVRSLRQPMFLDCTQIPSLEEYHEMLNHVVDAFANLPAEVREVFGDDPKVAMQWLAKASDRQVVELWRNCGLDPKAVATISKQPKAVEAGEAGIAAPKEEVTTEGAA